MRLPNGRYLGNNDPEASIGARVGRFTITRWLGDGAMGGLYLAEHAVLETRRAVRILSPELTENALRLQRLLQEARAAGRLNHRNLIQVHDVGQLPTGA